MMHGPINVKSPNNTSKWQMGFNSALKGLILFWVTLIQQNSVSLNFALILGPLWVSRCLVQISGSARPTTQRHIPENHRCKKLTFTVSMCFDGTYIQSLQTYIFIQVRSKDSQVKTQLLLYLFYFI